jgi:hypothetical protein
MDVPTGVRNGDREKARLRKSQSFPNSRIGQSLQNVDGSGNKTSVLDVPNHFIPNVLVSNLFEELMTIPGQVEGQNINGSVTGARFDRLATEITGIVKQDEVVFDCRVIISRNWGDLDVLWPWLLVEEDQELPHKFKIAFHVSPIGRCLG